MNSLGPVGAIDARYAGATSLGGPLRPGEAVPATGEHMWELWTYRLRLAGLATHLGAGRENAEDLAAEALLRCALSKSLNNGGEKLGADPWAYLAATVSNLVIDGRRRAHREARALDRSNISRPRLIEEGAAIRDAATRMLERLVRTEQSDTVTMVVYHILYQPTWKALGDEFGLSGSAARFRVRRAIDRLRTWGNRHLA